MSLQSRFNKITLGVAVLTFLAFSLGAEASKQLRERTLKRNAWRNEPVKILRVKNGKRLIGLGGKFSDGDDWLKSLTVRVKNVSSKPITFIELELHFPAPGDSDTDAVPVFPLTFGQASPPKAGVAHTSSGVMPGQFVDIALSDSAYEGLMQLLGNKSANVAELILREVHFSDDTKWVAGQHLERSGNDPLHWKEIGAMRVQAAAYNSVDNVRDGLGLGSVFF